MKSKVLLIQCGKKFGENIIKPLTKLSKHGIVIRNDERGNRVNTIKEIIGYLIMFVFVMGWMDTLWIFGVEDSQYYTWWGAIHYFGNL